ncbi:MAG: cytochrome c nitrite reductase small subunit [Bryobacteraceae bacterium]
MRSRGAAAPLFLAILFGLAAGLAAFTFGYARGASYLTDDPAACRNCHAMNEQFDGWLKSSHRSAAVCNDCHAPAGFFAKYFTKALNGFNHSLLFTTGRYPDHIQITGRNARIAEEACMKCHQEVTGGIRSIRAHGGPVHCTACHLSVGHAH